MNKIKQLLCNIALFGLAAASAQAAPSTTSELTMAQVQAQLPTIKNAARRTGLTTFFNECRNRSLFTCQLAWFDLHTVGLEMIYHQQSGLESYEFIKDPQSSEIYRAIAIALTHPSYRNGWDLIIRPKYASKELLDVVPAREGLHENTWNFATLDIVKQHFSYAGVNYDVNKGYATNPRAEWCRYLTLVFAIRGDTTNSLAAVGYLKTYAKMSTSDALLYNNTLLAVQKYLSTRGASK